MRLENIEKVQKILPQYQAAKEKLQWAQDLKSINLENGIDRELRDYDPPSNIGECFRKVQMALILLHQQELAVIVGALKALGAEVE